MSVGPNGRCVFQLPALRATDSKVREKSVPDRGGSLRYDCQTGSRKWRPRQDSNLRPFASYHYSFRYPQLLLFVVWTIPSPWAMARRCCPSSLCTFPAGLGSGFPPPTCAEGSLNLSRFTQGVSRLGAHILIKGGERSILLSYGDTGRHCNKPAWSASRSGSRNRLPVATVLMPEFNKGRAIPSLCYTAITRRSGSKNPSRDSYHIKGQNLDTGCHR